MEIVRIPVDYLAEFDRVLKNRRHDFWVSSLVGIEPAEMYDRMKTYRVEDRLAHEIFSHCFFMESQDVKRDADSLLDKFGLGLRKVKIRSKNAPGCIFAFINESGMTTLRKQRLQLADDDTRLSAEERVRRTSMLLTVTTMESVLAAAKQTKKFWVASWSDIDVEDAKKKAVCAIFEGLCCTQRFSECLLVEVSDLSGAGNQLRNKCGMGLRKAPFTCKVGPGVIAVFFETVAPMTKSATVLTSPEPSRLKRQMQGPMSSPGPTERDSKRRRELGGADGSKLRQAMSLETPIKVGREAKRGLGDVDPEELYLRQVAVLEKRLGELLPLLPREQLTTPFVQMKLEEYMQKPRGRLDKFKMEFARIWRSYLELSASNVPDLD